MTYPIDRASGLGVLAVTAIRLSACDVGEALVAAGVNPRVQEAENRLAGAETGVVDEGDDGGGELFEVSGCLTSSYSGCKLTGEAAEVPPLGVRAPPWKTG